MNVVLEFAEERVEIEVGPHGAKLMSSTLEDENSPLKGREAGLLHAIIIQHALNGVDVASDEYIKGLNAAIPWFLFKESR